MPVSQYGQLITFAVEIDASEKYTAYIWITARKGDTCRKIAARRGHPEMAVKIAQLNHIRNPRTKLHEGRRLKIPGTLKTKNALHLLAGDPPPIIKDGYAQYDIVTRPGREGLSRFLGYNPVVYDIAVQWQALRDGGDGTGIEKDIQELERMAGRGNFPGAAVGVPAVIRISVTDNAGNIVLLLPSNYQWSTGNPSAPLWRISNLTWDGAPLRLPTGRRVREKCVVEVTKYTPVNVVTRSATERSRARNSHHTVWGVPV